MTDTATRNAVADSLRELAVSMVDVAACVRDGADIGKSLLSLRGVGSCLHLLEMTLLHVDQIELRSEDR